VLETIYVVGLLFLIGCSERSSLTTSDKDVVCPSSSFLIPERQINEVKTKARSGDGNAAYKLYWHYMLGKNEPREAMRWLKEAVVAGNIDAKIQLEAENRRQRDRWKGR
jgi:hypothetical protein